MCIALKNNELRKRIIGSTEATHGSEAARRANAHRLHQLMPCNVSGVACTSREGLCHPWRQKLSNSCDLLPAAFAVGSAQASRRACDARSLSPTSAAHGKWLFRASRRRQTSSRATVLDRLGVARVCRPPRLGKCPHYNALISRRQGRNLPPPNSFLEF